MKKLYLISLLVCISMLPLAAIAFAQATDVDGLVTVASDLGVDDTVARLQSTIENQGLLLVATVDHAANAQSVDMELRPTRLLIFGNPNLGTQLMQDEQSVGIDLPQKLLVWQGEDEQVYVSYNDPAYLGERHGLDDSDEVLSTISNALGGLAGSVRVADEAQATPEALPETGAAGISLPWLLIGAGALSIAVAVRLSRQTWSKLLSLFAAILVLLLALTGIGTAQTVPAGMMTVDSPYTVQETVDRLQSTMQERGLTIMATVNHAQNAAGVDMDLSPTQLILFGNPRLGTPLMQAGQTMGIDLPQKMLVWEDADGQVHVSYNDPQHLADRHNLSGVDDVLGQISDALSGLAGAGTAQ